MWNSVFTKWGWWLGKTSLVQREKIWDAVCVFSIRYVGLAQILFKKYITCRHTCWEHLHFKRQAVVSCFFSLCISLNISWSKTCTPSPTWNLIGASAQIWVVKKNSPLSVVTSFGIDVQSPRILILVHLRWFLSCVSSSVSIQLEQKFPMTLKLFCDQRWRGRPTILTRVE